MVTSSFERSAMSRCSSNASRGLQRRSGRRRDGDVLGECVKLELDVQRAEARVVGLGESHRLEIERDRQIVANGHELLREERHVSLLEQRFARPPTAKWPAS